MNKGRARSSADRAADFYAGGSDHSGLESDGALFLLVALVVTNADEPRHWKEGTQHPSFKAKHEARR